MHWLAHVIGIDNGSGGFYLFYSGFAGFLLSLTALGGLITFYRRHQCHLRGCWRLGHHPAAGGLYVLCRHHHPDIAGARLTPTLIALAHNAYRRSRTRLGP